MGRFSRASSPAGAPIVNLPCGTTTISGQPFDHSRNDVPGAGVCVRAPASVAVIPSTAKPATPTITLLTDLFTLPPLPLFFAMLLLTAGRNPAWENGPTGGVSSGEVTAVLLIA